jgi:dolichol-phosphate mannosyltransferase
MNADPIATDKHVRPSLTCVLPVYNEIEGIAAAVAEVRAALDRYTQDSEIITVDDGSTDGTSALLDELAAAGQVRVIHLPANRGYGWALRTGFAAATRPLVFFTDSDRQFDAMDIGRLLPYAATAEVIIGQRIGRSDGALRGGLSFGYNALVRGLLGIRVRDINCAFKLMRRDVLAQFPLTSTRYTINAELIARATQAGFRVQEVPVPHRARQSGASKVGIGDIGPAIRELLSLRDMLRADRRG